MVEVLRVLEVLIDNLQKDGLKARQSPWSEVGDQFVHRPYIKERSGACGCATFTRLPEAGQGLGAGSDGAAWQEPAPRRVVWSGTSVTPRLVRGAAGSPS